MTGGIMSAPPTSSKSKAILRHIRPARIRGRPGQAGRRHRGNSGTRTVRACVDTTESRRDEPPDRRTPQRWADRLTGRLAGSGRGRLPTRAGDLRGVPRGARYRGLSTPAAWPGAARRRWQPGRPPRRRRAGARFRARSPCHVVDPELTACTIPAALSSRSRSNPPARSSAYVGHPNWSATTRSVRLPPSSWRRIAPTKLAPSPYSQAVLTMRCRRARAAATSPASLVRPYADCGFVAWSSRIGA